MNMQTSKGVLRYGITKSRAGHSHVWCILGRATWRSGRMEPHHAHRLCRAIHECDQDKIRSIDMERDSAPLLEMLQGQGRVRP